MGQRVRTESVAGNALHVLGAGGVGIVVVLDGGIALVLPEQNRGVTAEFGWSSGAILIETVQIDGHVGVVPRLEARRAELQRAEDAGRDAGGVEPGIGRIGEDKQLAGIGVFHGVIRGVQRGPVLERYLSAADIEKRARVAALWDRAGEHVTAGSEFDIRGAAAAAGRPE